MNIGQGTTDAGNPQTIHHIENDSSPVASNYDSVNDNLIRNTKSVLNELNSLKELTGEETMSHKSEYR